ncbi:PaaX family transcriptional regulator C-terminal domain-containing protein [uncultured Maritimibacter sp.]|jgi:phenylacetic acid degradation operon negative regulatory protein|uniref:PaaX family transcriptional regulator C-terminal domain-containing protein n=1 Tax=uncultured Maritimibacter sp. TaxID=991866 RepID=UPI0026170B5D|nr:PaaX family transcriptional regulator C-terminal domain-containing protein [uncultured Maritimibacter sp.]
MTEVSSPTQARIDALMAVGTVKVWSVVVTVMGDLCRAPEDRLSGRVLDRLMGPMGINNQALRTALHRLKRDGWIEATRDGRGSNYALTPEGRGRTESVRALIYAEGPSPAQPVHLLTPAPDATVADWAEGLPDDAILLPARTALLAGPLLALPAGTLVTTLGDTPLPDWARDAIASADLCAEYARLAKAVDRALADALTGDPAAGSTGRTILRLAAFHHYRRLRLRHGPLPDLLLGPDWPGAIARTGVMTLLRACPRPDLADLHEVHAI